jgi:RNA polymerase sigma-70 factor (ECF subfamily)
MGGVSGNEQFLTLLTSHQRRLVGYLRMLVPNRTDAEEILQEVNLHICRHADEFQLGTDFGAWALRTAHFCVLTWRERRSRDRLVFDDSLLERLAATAHSFDAHDNRYQEALEGCLQKLAPQEHQLITGLYSDPEATPQGMAERIGRSAKGIYVLLKRIRVKLLECVERTLAAEDRV